MQILRTEKNGHVTEIQKEEGGKEVALVYHHKYNKRDFTRFTFGFMRSNSSPVFMNLEADIVKEDAKGNLRRREIRMEIDKEAATKLYSELADLIIQMK